VARYARDPVRLGAQKIPISTGPDKNRSQKCMRESRSRPTAPAIRQKLPAERHFWDRLKGSEPGL